MEASDAGLTQDTTAAGPVPETPVGPLPGQEAPAQDEPVGNGFLVIVEQWEPGSIVELYRVDSDGVLRAEGGTRVDRRVVNALSEVGFSGLTPGDRFIAAGYSRGRYVEVRCVAHDESEPIELLQPPVGPSPTTIGTQGTPVATTVAAPSEAAGELGEGLPEGVTSPLLSDAEAQSASAVPVRADAGISPGDVDGVVVAPASQPEAPEGDAGPPADSTSSEAPGEAAGSETAPPVDDTQPSAEAPAPADAPAADAQAQPQGESPAVADASPQADTDAQKLAAQAEGLGIPDAQTLSVDQLRAAITEKQVTPVV